MPLSDEELKKIDPVKNLQSRPDWDNYFMSIALVVSQKSFDPSSKCGAIIVSKDNRVLSTGYNGPLKGSIDEEIPLIRPDRYFHFIHAEENALISYNGSMQDIVGSSIYITSRPCHRCLRMVLQKGIKNVFYGESETHVVDKNDVLAQKVMMNYQRNNMSINMQEIKNDGVIDVIRMSLKSESDI